MTFGKPIHVSPTAALRPVSIPTLDARNAMAEVLAAYLGCATFRVWGGDTGEDRDITVTVIPEWPGADDALPYPCAAITEPTDTEIGDHSFTPTPLESTYDPELNRGTYDPDCDTPTVLWKVGEATGLYQIDVWADNAPEIEAIAAMVPGLFNVAQNRAGVMLGGHPRYFDRPVRATLIRYRRQDNPAQVFANERRLRITVRLDMDAVVLCHAVSMRPHVAVDVSDPNDPPATPVDPPKLDTSGFVLPLDIFIPSRELYTEGMFLRLDDESTITTVDESGSGGPAEAVSLWSNAFGVDATQLNTGQRPELATNPTLGTVVRSDGLASWLNLTGLVEGGTSRTLYFVAEFADADVNNRFFDSFTGRIILIHNGPTNSFQTFDGVTRNLGSASPGAHLFRFTFDADELTTRLHVDGVEVGSDVYSPKQIGGPTVLFRDAGGPVSYTSGDWGAIYGYTGAHDDEVAGFVGAYLTSRWPGLPALP